jgi:hypothetical protein
MHWFDYGAIVAALALALFANSIADSALRASIVTYLRSVVADPSPYYVAGTGWVSTYDLRKIFGPSVYPALRKLRANDVIERFTEEMLGQRLIRDDLRSRCYRWKQPTK